MKYHIIAFLIGFILDLIIGDPYCLPHPIRLIGNLIASLEKHYIGPKDISLQEKYAAKSGAEKSAIGKRRAGRKTVCIILAATVLVTTLILVGGYLLHPIAGCVLESIMTYQILATKCLKVESMKVYDKLKNGTLEEARLAVSMIVGRDTKALSDLQVTRAAVETVAENTSDGVIAPMLYLAIGGPVLGFLYKAINTMDSMIAYKNDRYMDFGRTAAKLDDVANFLPARISAWLMIAACLFCGKGFSAGGAKRIYLRDRYNHASPNSAQTESACAGALGIRLAGPTSYFGKIIDKPYIGDANREICYEDIPAANRLLYGTAFLCQILCLIGMCLVEMAVV